MFGSKCRKAGALWVISQGLLTALAPQLSVAVLKKLIGQNFENAEELEAKPAYVRQLRAIGVGMVASGIVTLVLERGDEAEEEVEAPEQTEFEE